MLLRRVVVAVVLTVGGSIGGCGDTTGEPIYRSELAGPGAGGSDAHDAGKDRHCPDDVPEHDSRCGLRDHTFCSYDGGRIECECFADEWHCNYACPAIAPDLEDPHCDIPGDDCEYDDVFCVCTEQDRWMCVSGPRSCPLEAPNPGAFCETDGTLCPYRGFSCLCERDHWDCR